MQTVGPWYYHISRALLWKMREPPVMRLFPNTEIFLRIIPKNSRKFSDSPFVAIMLLFSGKKMPPNRIVKSPNLIVWN